MNDRHNPKEDAQLLFTKYAVGVVAIAALASLAMAVISVARLDFVAAFVWFCAGFYAFAMAAIAACLMAQR